MSPTAHTVNMHAGQSIVVGVDGSSPSRSAIRWSMHRAALTGASVVLAHIVEDVMTAPPAHMSAEITETEHAFLQAEVDFAHLIEHGVSVSSSLLQGDPLEQLAAASEHMVMLAIGTHKTGFVQGRIFGSKFIQLAARASSPVAFIPNVSTRRRGGIVVGVSDAAAEHETICFAAAEAARTGHELTIVHCWDMSRKPAALAHDRQEERARFGALFSDAVLAEAQTIAMKAQPQILVRTRSVRRPAAEGLIDASAAASLLVIGRSHRNVSLPGTVGSIAHDVLLNLNGATVVIHDTLPMRRRAFSHRTQGIATAWLLCSDR